MERHEILSTDEIHHFGIEIVCNRMQTEGFEIIGVDPSPAMTPQIVARRDDGRLCFVIVRTGMYPKKGMLANDAEFFYNLQHAERHDAICYFAGLRLANADAVHSGNEKKMGMATKGADFYVEYEGLKVMTTIDRMRIMDDRGIQNFDIEDGKPALDKKSTETRRETVLHG